MKNTFKIALVIYFLFLNFISFAQTTGPSSGDTGGTAGLEGGTGAAADGAPVPIDSKLWILIILGIVYSFFLIRRNHQQKKLS
jgi:hypothetical protein